MTRPRRYTHHHDGELVVFLIGMRIRQWWRLDRWLPVFCAMPGMLRELSADPESGLLGYRLVFSLRGPWVVQYWSSHQRLYAYAHDTTAAHRPAWAAYNRRARQSPTAVGIWHETFQVAGARSVYVGTGPEGLATATTPVELGPAGDRPARPRLG